MTNNDILRRIRYTFNFTDSNMVDIFTSADYPATREEICNWLKKEEDDSYKNCSDKHLSLFLNGFINKRRGKREGTQPEPEKTLTNNIILNKLRIALNIQADGMLEILKLADFRFSKHELSALFRKKGHKHYRQCKDQILRNFLHGMQLKYRPSDNIKPTE